MALALEATLRETCVARFESWLLFEAKEKQPSSTKLSDLLGQKLEAAFPGAGFQVAIKEAE
jgi:hypothetical protein